MQIPTPNRRQMLQATAVTGAATWLGQSISPARAEDKKPTTGMRFGLVTYMWAADWDLPTLLKNCKEADCLGVELRTMHKHGVEPSLNAEQRKEVKARFADSPVTLVGLGSNQNFDSPDASKLAASMEASKKFLQLSHDIGASGVKVKPDSFHKDVPKEKTIEQIGRSLNELGKVAKDLGQQVRLEIHGGCAEIPTIKAIMEVADHPSVALCWNCNKQDTLPPGLEKNFELVRARFGDTLHIHELENKSYPHAELFKLLVASKYSGWALLEAASKPSDRPAALKAQRQFFDEMLQKL